GRPRFGGPAGAMRSDPLAEKLLRSLLPVLRGAVSSERSKVLVVDRSARTLEFVSSREAAELVTVGAACPDHLVHTKRLPLWVPFQPGLDDTESLRQRLHELVSKYRDDYRRYVCEYGNEGTVRGDPNPRVVLIQHVALIGVGTTAWAARLSRD